MPRIAIVKNIFFTLIVWLKKQHWHLINWEDLFVKYSEKYITCIKTYWNYFKYVACIMSPNPPLLHYQNRITLHILQIRNGVSERLICPLSHSWGEAALEPVPDRLKLKALLLTTKSTQSLFSRCLHNQ